VNVESEDYISMLYPDEQYSLPSPEEEREEVAAGAAAEEEEEAEPGLAGEEAEAEAGAGAEAGAAFTPPSRSPSPKLPYVVGGLYNLNAVDPQLESAWFQPSKPIKREIGFKVLPS
jgi:hypothetical protein